MDFLGTIGHLILTPLYYAVSAVLLAWHWLFSLFLHPDGGASWVLSIVGLTLVVRAALIPLFVKQIKSSRNMQLIQPKVKELQKKYGHDRERLAQETMALYKETGTNPFAACLPLLVQSPIFIALFRLLDQAQKNDDRQRLHDARSRPTASANAKLFGTIPISATFLHNQRPGQRPDPGRDPGGRDDRHHLHHPAPADEQEHAGRRDERARTPSSRRCCSTCCRWSFAVGGVAFPIGVLVYWTTTNLWTMGRRRRRGGGGRRAPLRLRIAG